MTKFRLLVLVVAGSLLASCASNGSQQNPNVNKVNLNNDKLQMAVGTANVGPDGFLALNVVATYRQPGGLSAVLLDTPTITGPAGFVVPNSAPSMDAGTDHISGSPQVVPGQTPEPTTFSSSGGAFSYGFGPFNSDNGGDPFYPGNPPLYVQPFYSSCPSCTGGVPSVGGPPAYPFFNDGTFPAGFEGYSQGFSAFDATPVTGAYSLSVNVPIVGTNGFTATASANLNDLTPIPLPTNVSLTEDGLGGGTANVTVPADARDFETLIYIGDEVTGLFFTVGPLTGSGALSGNLPDNLGQCFSPGCENGPNAVPTIGSGDPYFMYAVTYDYPAFEAGPPSNRQILPTISNAGSGQADLAMSLLGGGTYSKPFSFHRISPRDIHMHIRR